MAEAKVHDAGAEIKQQSLKEFGEKTTGKPTPTQEENDRAALGEHVVDKEPDGSPPDPGMPPLAGPPSGSTGPTGPSGAQHRQSGAQASSAGAYSTRQSRAGE